MVMYRKDLFEKAGLTMPDAPTWDFIADAARKITDKASEIYGICLRGKAGWGENMAFLTATPNSFGARWFDENWKPQFDQPEWKNTLDFYVKLMKDAGPPGASSNGFNENLALFNSGKCGMWIDATVAASFVTNPKESKVADKVGFALAPDNGLGKRGNWLWAWSLAVPAGSQKADAAQKFIAWATSKDYLELVAAKEGWANVPPGTRTSLYENPEYQKAAPFAKMTLDSINSADPTKPTVKPVPYVGVQFVAIPEFQGLGTTVGQHVLGRACRATRRSTRRSQQAQAIDDPRDDQGRLHQVAICLPDAAGRPASRRAGAASSAPVSRPSRRPIEQPRQATARTTMATRQTQTSVATLAVAPSVIAAVPVDDRAAGA